MLRRCTTQALSQSFPPAISSQHLQGPSMPVRAAEISKEAAIRQCSCWFFLRSVSHTDSSVRAMELTPIISDIHLASTFGYILLSHLADVSA